MVELLQFEMQHFWRDTVGLFALEREFTSIIVHTVGVYVTFSDFEAMRKTAVYSGFGSKRLFANTSKYKMTQILFIKMEERVIKSENRRAEWNFRRNCFITYALDL